MSVIRKLVKDIGLRILNGIGPGSEFFGSPRYCSNLKVHIDYFGLRVIQVKDEDIVQIPSPNLNKSEIPQEFLKLYSRKSKRQSLAVIPGGRVWGMNGAVIGVNDHFLADVSREFGIQDICRHHSAFKVFRLGTVKKLPGNVAVIATAGANVYYHWIFDVLPRLLMLIELGLLEQLDFIICNDNGLQFQKDTLKFLGVTERSMLRPKGDKRFHIKAENLFVPSLPSVLGEVNSWEIGLLRKYLIPMSSGVGYGERIYISRRKAGNRIVVNEDDLYFKLNSYGFQILNLEEIPLAQQIKIFQEARIIIGAHGSGFTNIIFCNERAKIVDILPESNIVPCFYNIASIIGLKYYGFISTAVPINQSNKNDNIYVDIDDFFQFLVEYHIIHL